MLLMDAWAGSLGSMEPDARLVAVAFVAGQDVEIPPDELNEALRRALVVRAVGGSPARELALDEDAVIRLACDLDLPERRDALRDGLEALGRTLGEGRDGERARETLLADGDLAWRCFAAGRLAGELE